MKNYCYCCMKELPEGSHICPFCGYDNSRPQNDRLLLPEGSILNGKYLVGKKLGKGGFGVTYIGRELQLDIIVAIKEYFPSGLSTRDFNAKSVLISTSGEHDPERFRAGEEDFRNEVQRLTKFNSPYIAHVREYFLENNTAYIVMDYVDGVSFSDEIKAQGRIPWERVLSLMLPLMPELDKLHQQDMIHRDIKPENIKIVHDSDTGKEFSVLLDFGAARSFTAELTGDYTAVLTPGYAPLEQYKTHSKQGTFTDVYALCAAIYKAITGETPTPAIDMVDGEESIKPISSFGIDIPAYVEKALMHGLALKSQDRTQNMRELYYELTTPPSDTGANVQKEKSSASANEALKKTDDSDAKSKSKDSGRNPDSPAPAVQHEKHEDKHEAVHREAPKAVEKKPVKPQRKSILRFLLPLAALIAVCVVLTQVYGRTPVSIESIESAEVELDSTPGEQDPQELYELGLEAGRAKDYETAFEYFQPAAEQGHADAQNSLGDCYYYGRGVEQDYDEAVKWYRLAAKQGNATAQTNLGYCYKTGRGVEQDYTAAVKWYRLAADQGYADAQNKLGWMYANGRGVEQDYAEAVKWYRLAADQGNATAQCNLGLMYENGYGVEQNFTEAVKWYQLAADQGDADAANKVKELATALTPTASTSSQKSSSDIDYSSLEVGDIITFGSYEQDNDSSNGKEDIEWQVLAREGSRVFLISKYALDCQPYNTDWTDVTWENSTLRTWLNGTFLNNAFTSSEQAVIAQTTVTADKNPKFNTNPGNATTDKVFLLSIEEAKKYFPSHSARWCEATAFADAKGALIVYDNSWWWLRSPGCRQDYAAGVSTDGSVSHNGDYVHLNYNAVRPALWIDLES